jgi:hypothetical protein
MSSLLPSFVTTDVIKVPMYLLWRNEWIFQNKYRYIVTKGGKNIFLKNKVKGKSIFKGTGSFFIGINQPGRLVPKYAVVIVIRKLWRRDVSDVTVPILQFTLRYFNLGPNN